jgi:hypothetical protein
MTNTTKTLTISGPGSLDDPTFDVSLAGHAARRDALELAADIVAVTNDAELADCVAAAGLVRELTDACDAAYKLAKAPLKLGIDRLDYVKHGFNDALALEKDRLKKLASDYTTARDAEARRLADEAKRQQAEKVKALAESGADLDTLREAMMEGQNLPVVKSVVPGARTTTRWDYEVEDIRQLWDAFPGLVEATPRRFLILEAIKGGQLLPGLRIFQRTTVSPQ